MNFLFISFSFICFVYQFGKYDWFRSRGCKNYITSETFLRYFKFENRNIKIMRIVNTEVKDFEERNTQFLLHLQQEKREHARIDMIFEFQSWMNLLITEIQKRVADQCNFHLIHDSNDFGNEVAHIASLTNRLKTVLYDVRVLALGVFAENKTSELRSCNYCGQIWSLAVGCTGETTCGNLVSAAESRTNDLFSYSFFYDRIKKELTIVSSGTRRLASLPSVTDKIGCGQSIAWDTMVPVPVPEEFSCKAKVSVDDVRALERDIELSWSGFFSGAFKMLALR